MTYLTQEDPPFFIEQGTADCTVAPGQSQIFQALMQSNGHDSSLKFLESAGHGGPLFVIESNMLLVDNFWNTTLRYNSSQTVIVSGRVSLPSGEAIPKAKVTITDSNGVSRSISTNRSGNYSFTDVLIGETYTFKAAVRGKTFTPNSQTFYILKNRENINFVSAN
jgi:hypothetical protein